MSKDEPCELDKLNFNNLGCIDGEELDQVDTMSPKEVQKQILKQLVLLRWDVYQKDFECNNTPY